MCYLMTAGLTLKNRDSVATLQVNPSSCLSFLTSVAWREGMVAGHRGQPGLDTILVNLSLNAKHIRVRYSNYSLFTLRSQRYP